MSIELVAEEGVLKGLILNLDDGETWTVGRDPDECTFLLEDPKVSRKHILFEKTEDGIVVTNLSHTNPARVNDKTLLEPRLLHDLDKVTIGGTLFRFYAKGRESQIVEDADDEEIEPLTEETIFREDEANAPQVHFDLREASRFVLKVVAGPNTGAEVALEPDKQYVIGTDVTLADIVFHDLSVSREHARITLASDGTLSIEDLESRNGVVVNRERILGRAVLTPNALVSLGTSSFIVIDREAPLLTIASPLLEEERAEPESPAPVEEKEPMAPVVVKKPLAFGTLILSTILAGLVILLGVGLISLFQEKEVQVAKEDVTERISQALAPFPGVRFSYNPQNGKLLLVGHVTSGVAKNELLYNLQGFGFIHGIEDNVVNDEAVWQEMNILLSKKPAFQGVSMHSPSPGVFVLNGYLKTTAQASQLTDYMNLNFNYLEGLQNNVIVEEQLIDQVQGILLKSGFNGVAMEFSTGTLVLTGYISSADQDEYNRLVQSLQTVNGVRAVRNYVVALTPEQAVVDLNERYPGRYQVTGYSKHGDVSFNVVVNGRILMRGDAIDGMTITSIQPHTVFLEKDGLKYKIEYNK